MMSLNRDHQDLASLERSLLIWPAIWIQMLPFHFQSRWISATMGQFCMWVIQLKLCLICYWLQKVRKEFLLWFPGRLCEVDYYIHLWASNLLYIDSIPLSNIFQAGALFLCKNPCYINTTPIWWWQGLLSLFLVWFFHFFFSTSFSFTFSFIEEWSVVHET